MELSHNFQLLALSELIDNFHSGTDEISRQLIDSGTSVIFGLAMMAPILQKSVEMTKKPIKIVYVKEAPTSQIPANGINFCELTDPKGKRLFYHIPFFCHIVFFCFYCNLFVQLEYLWKVLFYTFLPKT